MSEELEKLHIEAEAAFNSNPTVDNLKAFYEAGQAMYQEELKKQKES